MRHKLEQNCSRLSKIVGLNKIQPIIPLTCKEQINTYFRHEEIQAAFRFHLVFKMIHPSSIGQMQPPPAPPVNLLCGLMQLVGKGDDTTTHPCKVNHKESIEKQKINTQMQPSIAKQTATAALWVARAAHRSGGLQPNAWKASFFVRSADHMPSSNQVEQRAQEQTYEAGRIHHGDLYGEKEDDTARHQGKGKIRGGKAILKFWPSKDGESLTPLVTSTLTYCGVRSREYWYSYELRINLQIGSIAKTQDGRR